MMSTVLECTDATHWMGEADLVLTHPYAPLPAQLRDKPMLINQFPSNRDKVDRWCGAELVPLGDWGNPDTRNRIWVGNVDARPVMTGDLIEDEEIPGHGWFPLELPLRLLKVYARPGMTVWDGFMGRGTVGRACKLLELSFIGLDINPERVEMAREYIDAA